MKPFGARGQRVLKIIHLITASLWVGGAVTLLLTGLWLGPADSGPELFGYDLARKFVDDFIVIPGAMGCLFSGLFISWLTPWGFFRHRWVAAKWILTIACILFGTFYLGPIINTQPLTSRELGLAATHDPQYIQRHFSNALGGGIQVLIIIFMVAISVLKPWKKKTGAG